MRRLRNKALISTRKLIYSRRSLNVPQRYLHKDVQYFSQWESANLNKKILKKEIKAEDDPHWARSGAKSRQEYTLWSWNGCGMACLKMILAQEGKGMLPLVKLGKKCAEYGGYIYPLETSVGLLYKPFIKFVEKEFDLKGKILNPMVIEDIIKALGNGDYVIAGVSPEIREPDKKPKLKGGHLVLMLGYDLNKKELYLHNPSGLSNATQNYAVISFDKFKKFFSNRGIVIETSK